MTARPLLAAGLFFLASLGTVAAADTGTADSDFCVDCVRVRVGPPIVVRGPYPDELDAPFAALKLADGTFRGFSANGSTYAIDGPSLMKMDGPRREVLESGAPGSINDCGRWLTSVTRVGDEVLGFVHQEHACDYNAGRTDKSMAIARSSDDGLTWTDLGTVITGTEAPQPGQINGEGDCTMVDGLDGYLYGYCLRNTDWQTIAARAPVDDPTAWHKYHDSAWREPGLGGQATAIGFTGTGVGYLKPHGWIAAITTDRWFGGVRLSLSEDKVSFVDLKDPLLPIDGADWERPADTDLSVYGNILNPDDGSSAVGPDFLLSYIYVPAGKSFSNRYLVQHEVSLSVTDQPLPVQAGLALSRWVDPERDIYITSAGPLTGNRQSYRHDTIVAYLLTRAPEATASVKIEECSSDWAGHLDHMLAEDGGCAAIRYTRERTAGWLYATAQPDSVPVYRCSNAAAQTHFASNAADCEGLGTMDFVLGYGLTP